MLKPFSQQGDISLYLGNSLELTRELPFKFDMVFADPPYFLSDDGFTVRSGKIVSVNKGDWDVLKNYTLDEFNYQWISNVREKMTKNATIWISGTMHNIFSIYNVLLSLNFKILNVITWEKTNPPPNFTKKVFTHSTELIIWARKETKHTHKYNYELMKLLNNGRQMKDVWKLPAIAPWEKKIGKHPTQKPLSILSRVILSSTESGDLILDPFTGSSTTGVAAKLLGRKFVGIDISEDYLKLSQKRLKEADNSEMIKAFRTKIHDVALLYVQEINLNK